MNRFDGVPLSVEPSIRRVVRAIQRQRAEILAEVVELLSSNGLTDAAALVHAKIEAEAKEVE